MRTPKDDTVHKRGSHVPAQSARRQAEAHGRYPGGAKETRPVKFWVLATRIIGWQSRIA